MSFLSSPKFRKFAILLAYAVVGAAVQAGYLPPEIRSWLSENALEAILVAMGVGHILPEAARKDPPAPGRP